MISKKTFIFKTNLAIRNKGCFWKFCTWKTNPTFKKQIIVDRIKTLENEMAVRKEKEMAVRKEKEMAVRKEKALHQKEKKIRDMIFLFNNRFYNS